ncbi:MAG: tRNA (adenosine(37)-N6)-threonylcarbamoyltransferase complex dimerization subunit type 1 TsaB [Neisseriaceae bacterium]|nr:tRNA (adenosine(37)-N6)-threonylcarbamoyltransferase complex dimerization subunit type 1 TsaB [Neisseriaceae bacterium]
MMPDFNRPVLAIDTGSSQMSLTLRAHGRDWVYAQSTGPQQSEHLLPALQRLLSDAQVNIADLSAIVYNQGPGMFTGLRIGIGVAQGLSAPWDIPLIGIPSLDAVAYQIADYPCVLAAIDARMNEVFYAWFDTQNHRRLSEYQVGKAEKIRQPENMNNITAKGIGNGFVEPINNISGNLKMPTASDFLQLASTGRYPVSNAEQATLIYVRDKVALTIHEQKK